MAATTQSTMASIDALLKTQYQGPIESALNEQHEILKLLGDDNRKPSGHGIVFPVRLQYNTSARAMGETDNIPASNRSVEVDATVEPTQIAGRLQLTVKVLKNAANDKDAFVEDLTYEMEQLQSGLKNDLDRQLAGRNVVDSSAYKTGILAQATAQALSTATSVTVDNNQMFNEGDQIVYGTLAELAATSVGTTIVTGVSDNGTTITVEALPATLDANDYIAKGNGTANSQTAFNKELLGIDFGVDDADATFEEIDAAAKPRWKSVVNSNSGTARPLAVEDMQALCTSIQIKSGRMPKVLVCHPKHRDQYVQLLDPQVRYMPREPKGGYKGSVTFQHGETEFTFVTSRYSRLGVMYFLDTDAVKKNWSQKPQWMDEDGAVLSRVVDKTSYEATMTAQLALCWRNRITSGRLEDLSY